MSPRAIWLWFAVSLVVLLTALAWVTRSTLRLEGSRQLAARNAAVQEKVRLALWRMDAAASAVLIREGARPPGQFRAFTAPSQAWTNTFQSFDNGLIVIPSPLLTEAAEHVLLHFEMTAGDVLTSPQVPVGGERRAAEERFNTSPARMDADRRKLEKLRVILTRERQLGHRFACAPAPQPGVAALPAQNAPATFSKGEQGKETEQLAATEIEKSRLEFSKRASALNQGGTVQQAMPKMKEEMAAKDSDAKVKSRPKPKTRSPQQAAPPSVRSLTEGVVSVGPFRAVWVEHELLLVREVLENGVRRYQGVWLDWPELRGTLLREITDLFPAASLVAAKDPPPSIASPPSRSPSRDGVDSFRGDFQEPEAANMNPQRFATLPVTLVTGAMKASAMPQWTPFRRSLAIAWGCVLLAAAAVAALLRGTVALSERRAAFVSAVTHELRTPLTTFRLYAELLANDMLPTAQKRAEYLGTLQAEAERLSHLVENVLAYARLERSSATAQAERLTLRELIGRVRPTLERRVEQAQARLVVNEGGEADLLVEVDVAAVEQILFNLVDNACKYAAPHSEENIIHLETGVARGTALLRVRDHGRGIHRSETRRIFRAFHKSAQQAAQSAPGVGLGLALCRKLSHALGGDVRLETKGPAVGACFVLEMPLASL